MVKKSKANSWNALPVSSDIASIVENEFGFSRTTEIQKRCIPQFLAHKDVVVQAPTGSGKTLAFVVPVLEILRKRAEPWNPWQIGALVLVPNRELALQISDTIQTFLKKLPEAFKVITFIGGTKVETDVTNFKQTGGNVVVATPGRLCDLLNRKIDSDFSLSGHLKTLEVLVLDEADRLLELGFKDSLREILIQLPKQRRTGLFSATQSDELDEIAKTGLRNPEFITVYAGQSLGHADVGLVTPASLNNFYTIVDAERKFVALRSFLRLHSGSKILVFFSTCACVDYFGDLLKRFKATKTNSGRNSSEDAKDLILTLHGKKKQKRLKVFEQFRGRSSGVLICTDVMARGIDIADIDWVVQFDPPKQASWFVHRCGRTARCGKSGNALLLLTPSEEGYLEFLQRNQNVTLTSMDIRAKPGREWTSLEKIRKMATRSRELLEKGTRAFVSFIEAYSKHDCRIVCSLRELDVVNTAHCFGLLRLPKMPELRGRDLSGFRKCSVNTSDIPYEDKSREIARMKRLQEQRSDHWNGAKRQVRSRKVGPRVQGEPSGETGKRKRKSKDFDELDDDYRLVKKFKKGKMSKEKFDEHFFNDL